MIACKTGQDQIKSPFSICHISLTIVKDNEISKRFQNTIWNNQHFPSMQDKRLIVVLYYAEKMNIMHESFISQF